MANLITTPQTIPQDFQPRLEARLLVQPDKTYVYARWLRAAQLQAELGEVMGDQMDVIKAQTAAGAPLDRGDIANMVEALSAGMGGPLDVSGGLVFPDLVEFVMDAKTPGDTVLLNRPRFLGGSTSLANRKLNSSVTFFGGSTQALQMDQVSVTVADICGPLDASGNRAPVVIDLFTQTRAFHDLLAQAQLVLVQDRNKYLDDNVITTLLAAADANSTHVLRGGDAASNAAFTQQGNEPFSFDLLPKAAEVFANDGIPGINNGRRYICVLDPHQKQQLENDAQWQRLVRYYPEMSPVYPGYVGETNAFILCESNNHPRLTGIGENSDLTGYQALVLAPKVFGWALTMNPRLMRDKNDDGDRFTRLGWQCFEGMTCLDDRFVQKIITD